MQLLTVISSGTHSPIRLECDVILSRLQHLSNSTPRDCHMIMYLSALVGHTVAIDTLHHLCEVGELGDDDLPS